MAKINDNYLKLQGSYLFSTIGKKVREYEAAHPEKKIIRLGIGDVTQPIAPAIIDALHKAVDEMGAAESFKGYAPDLGYGFLREVIAEKDFKNRGCDIAADEIFISDGAKCDCGNIQEIFSIDNTIAVCDPVYPVYVDSNVMAGRTGTFDDALGQFKGVVYMPCTEGNGFVPQIPTEHADLIYLCFPNNPTGAVIKKDELQKWVDYANANGSVILYDAAYEAFIEEDDVPHSIFECDGAQTCAIEFRSFSKTAGFTGLRCGYTVVPHELVFDGTELNALWMRRQSTKFNGVSYITQCGAAAIYSDVGQKQIQENLSFYRKNARLIFEGVTAAGFKAFGGKNSPYVWMQIPEGYTSWSFFDELLEKCQVVGTPGSGFGKKGEGYLRLTGFGSRERTIEAIERIKKVFGKK